MNSKLKDLILLDTDRTEKNLLDELKKDISILMANQTGTIEDYRMYAEVSQDLSIIDRKIDYLGWKDVNALYNSLQNIIKLINSTLSIPKEEEISQYVIDQSAAIKGSKDNINRIINKVNNLKKSPSNKVKVANNIYVKYYKNSYESMNQDEYNTVIKIVDKSLKQIEKIEFGGEFSEYHYQYLNGERATDRGRDLKSYGLTSADHDIGQLVKAGIKREEIIKLYKTNEVAMRLTKNIPSQDLKETSGYEYYRDTFSWKLIFKKYPTNYEFAFSAYDALVRRINDLDSMAQVYAAVYNSIGYETTIYQRHVYIKINGKWWSKDFYQVDEKENVIRL